MKKVIKTLFADMQKIAPATMRSAGNLKFAKLVAPICFFLICLSCGNKNEIDINRQYLEGTKWKLAGIVNVETGDIYELAPKECICIGYSTGPNDNNIKYAGNCAVCTSLIYTIAFDDLPHSICDEKLYSFSTYSSVNDFTACYEVNYMTRSFQIINLLGTRVGEVNGDQELYIDAIRSVQSFSLKKNELRLYYNDNNNYLLFKPIK